MQETCVRLMGKKLLVSLAMEGKFASDGLQAINEGDDILMAMARELVTEKGIGESADAVWKKLVEKQAEVFKVRAVETSPSDMETELPERDVPEVIMLPPARGHSARTSDCPCGISDNHKTTGQDLIPRTPFGRWPNQA